MKILSATKIDIKKCCSMCKQRVKWNVKIYFPKADIEDKYKREDDQYALKLCTACTFKLKGIE